MSTIDLYQVLREIPKVSDDKARKAAESVADADRTVTKDYLDARLEALENKLTWRIVIVCGICSGIIIAAIGLMFRLFLPH